MTAREVKARINLRIADRRERNAKLAEAWKRLKSEAVETQSVDLIMKMVSIEHDFGVTDERQTTNNERGSN